MPRCPSHQGLQKPHGDRELEWNTATCRPSKGTEAPRARWWHVVELPRWLRGKKLEVLAAGRAVSQMPEGEGCEMRRERGEQGAEPCWCRAHARCTAEAGAKVGRQPPLHKHDGTNGLLRRHGSPRATAAGAPRPGNREAEEERQLLHPQDFS